MDKKDISDYVRHTAETVFHDLDVLFGEKGGSHTEEKEFKKVELNYTVTSKQKILTYIRTEEDFLSGTKMLPKQFEGEEALLRIRDKEGKFYMSANGGCDYTVIELAEDLLRKSSIGEAADNPSEVLDEVENLADLLRGLENERRNKNLAKRQKVHSYLDKLKNMKEH